MTTMSNTAFSFRKIFTVAAAALTMSGAMALSTTEASAGYWKKHGGAVAAGVVGGLAVGAMLGAATAPAYAAPAYGVPAYDPGYAYGGHCYSVRRSVWSDWHGGYVTRRVRVCE